MDGRRLSHRQRCRWALLLLAVVLSASGCVGGSPPKPPSVPSNPNLADCRPLYIVGDSPAATRPFEVEAEELCRRFGVRPESRNPSYLTGEISSYVATSPQPVDLVIIPPRSLNVYVEQNLIQPVDRWIDTNSEWFTDILPLYRNLYMRFGGHYYGFVYDGDSQLLFYRKDLFRRLQLSVPNTWAEYDQTARTLASRPTPSGEEHFGTAFISVEQKAYMIFAERFASLGGHYFDAQMRPQIAGDLGVKVLTDLVNLQRETAPDARYDWEDLNHALLGGRIPMAIQFSDTARFSYDASVWKSQVAGQLDWALVPGGLPNAPRGGIWFGRILAVTTQSALADTAAKVAMYMTGPEVSARMNLRSDTINDPYRASHFKSEAAAGAFPSASATGAYYQALEQSLRHPMADLTIPGGWDYTTALDLAVVKAMRRDATPEQALQEAAGTWDRITAQYGVDSQLAAYRDWLVRLGEQP